MRYVARPWTTAPNWALFHNRSLVTRRLVVFGLSISSSWGNGHATTYRGLLKALSARGWETTFFERDTEWYRNNRDLAEPSFCDLRLFENWASTRPDAASAVGGADVVIVGSYTAHAQEIIDWLAGQGRPVLFYDIDTPITLTAFRQKGETEYLRSDQVRLFEVYLSFTGGSALWELEHSWGAKRAEALYCAVDPSFHQAKRVDPNFECLLGYMGTYAPDRQAKLNDLLISPARRLSDRRFVIAGALYPDMELPRNVELLQHIYPADHAAFYSSNWATLNLTRDAMVRYGWSPSVRLFEAAACGACILSDAWPGLNELFEPGEELLLVRDDREVLSILSQLTPERRGRIGEMARERVLREHTYEFRATQVDATLSTVLRGASAAEHEC
ncbi:MAG TPA: glycosyltransferase [Chloroflexota bacterium]|nr:glycosyltransferase [Chloroflexota bacterium]